MFDGNAKAQVSLDSSTPLLQMGKFEIDDTGYVNPLSKDTVLLDGFSGGVLTLSDETGRLPNFPLKVSDPHHS